MAAHEQEAGVDRQQRSGEQRGAEPEQAVGEQHREEERRAAPTPRVVARRLAPDAPKSAKTGIRSWLFSAPM